MLLDFINEIAGAVAEEEPDILVSTLIYQYTEKPPLFIKPADNVQIVLCDTASNVLQPLTAPENAYFKNTLEGWSRLAKHIRIWDYNVTYQPPYEMPYNSEWTYAADLKLFRDNHVEQVFCEFEYPVLADCRDYKLYLKTALLADPDADTETLSRRFALDYYGAAADSFLDYRELLKRSQDAHQTSLGMYPTANAFSHLDFDTVAAAQALFDRGETLLANDSDRLRRWRHARLPLDRATLIRARSLMGDYLKRHGSLEGYPFDAAAIGERIRETVREQAARRMEEKSREELCKQIDKEIACYSAPVNPRSLNTPEPFRDIPLPRLFDHTMQNTARWGNVVKLVPDGESDIGEAACISFPHENPEVKIDPYRFPLVFGIYSPSLRNDLWRYSFPAGRVAGPGYHWYKLGETRLTGDCYMYFFQNWYIQEGLGDAFDMNEPDAQYEIWVSMKVTGQAYPHGRAGDSDSISFDRLMLIRKPYQ